MERREIEEVLDAMQAARGSGRHVALATVVRVKGSAYRREGARMLIRDDGAITCMLSGGCLEPDVAEVARRVMARGVPELRHYDLDEDVVWGLGLGCGGSVDVYIEPVDNDPLLARWLDLLSRGDLAVLAMRLSPERQRLLVTSHGETAGGLGAASLDARVQEVSAEIMAAQSPRAVTRHVQQDGAEAVEVFLDVSAPPPELVIFGAGHDAIPVAALAHSLGWHVTIVDGRAAFLTPERFPGARLVLAHPAQFDAQVVLGARSYVLIMNHHVERDQAALGIAIRSDAPYVGMLGPRARYETLLDGLKDEGVVPTPEQLSRVRNPIGLDIGAESPDEVALSIIAAVLAARRGFAAGFLDGVSGRIHDPAAR
ncbi:MAG: XdhC/CoxI family protein [Luteitalea sp.]|nr:XdhC/CoxI family protein [Luteitalea sp.]